MKIKGIHIVIYKPSLDKSTLFNPPIIRDLDEFKRMADIIITNRRSERLAHARDKVYTQDLFGQD